MLDTAQNLQPTPINSTATGNPQQISNGSLQPQTSNGLQGSSQTVSSINQLNNGGSTIRLAATVSAAKPDTPNQDLRTQPLQILVIGLVAVVCAAILGIMVQRLLKPQQ